MVNKEVGRAICWKCGDPVGHINADLLDARQGGDGLTHFAHKDCGAGVKPQPPLLLVARHCRGCDIVALKRKDGVGFSFAGPHDRPGTQEACLTPDWGPEVVIAEVPW